MAYTISYLPSNTASVPARRYFVADTAAELPTAAPAVDGDIGYAKDDDTFYSYDGTTWNAAGGGGGGNGIIGVTFDGGGSAIAAGSQADLRIQAGRTITSVTLLADTSGSIVIDIWKDTYANYPPTDADSITAAAPPTISSATKSEDTTLTGWTTTITAGDCLRFNVDSCSTITRCVLILKVT